MTDLDRPLGATEEIFWRFDSFAPINFGVLTSVEGINFELDKLQATINALTERHPLLRARIARVGDTPWFKRSEQRPIAHFIEGTIKDAWQLLEQEISTVFDTEKGPLVRFFVLRDTGVSHILIVFHHSISDGRSGFFCTQDLLRGYHSLATTGDCRLVPLPSVPYCGDELIGTTEAQQRSQARTPITIKAMIEWMAESGVLVAFRPDRSPTDQPRRIRVVPRYFEAEVATALLAKAGEKGVKIQSVLNAALAMAAAEDAQVRGYEAVPWSAAIDLRGELSERYKEVVSCLATGYGSVCKPQLYDNLWDLSATIGQELIGAIEGQLHHAQPVIHSGLTGLSRFMEKFDSTLMNRLIHQFTPEGLTVSNLGRVQFDLGTAPYNVTGFAFASNTSVLNYLNTSAASINNQLTWTFSGDTTRLSEKRLADIAEQTSKILTTAAD